MSDRTPRFPDEDLHAWVDGRLDAARAAEIEAAMRDDPALAETLHAWRAQRDGLARLGRDALDEPVPDAMRRQMAAAIAEAARAPQPTRAPAAHGAWRIAAAAAVVGAAALGFALGRGTAPGDAPLARQDAGRPVADGGGNTAAPTAPTGAGGTGAVAAPTGAGGTGTVAAPTGAGGTGTVAADTGPGGAGSPGAATDAGRIGAQAAVTGVGVGGTGAPTGTGGSGAPLGDGAAAPRLAVTDPSAPPVFVRAAAVAHGVYVPEVRHPVEVSGDERGHLVAWLSKRLGSTLVAPDLVAEGFELVGGRLLPGERGPSAQLMYQDAQGLRITLYVARGEGAADATAFRFERSGAVQSFYWIDRGLGYVLSGELPREQLSQLATAVYRALEAAPR